MNNMIRISIIIFFCALIKVCVAQTLLNSQFSIDPEKDTFFDRSVLLRLNSDSTFLFQCLYDYGGYTFSQGKWTVLNNKLFINSNLKKIEYPIAIEFKKQKKISKSIAITLSLYLQGDISCNDKFYFQPYFNETIRNSKSKNEDCPDMICYTKRPKIGLYNNSDYTFYVDTLINSIRFETSKYNFYNIYNNFNKQITYPLHSELKSFNTEYGDSINIKFHIDTGLFGYRVFKNKEISITDENQLQYNDFEDIVVLGPRHFTVYLKRK